MRAQVITAALSKPLHERSPEARLWFAVATQAVEDIVLAFRYKAIARVFQVPRKQEEDAARYAQLNARSAIRSLFFDDGPTELMAAAGVPISSVRSGMRKMADREGLLGDLEVIIEEYRGGKNG